METKGKKFKRLTKPRSGILKKKEKKNNNLPESHNNFCYANITMIPKADRDIKI